MLTVLQTSFKKLVKLSLLLQLLPKSFWASHFSNKKGKDEFVSLTVFSPKISQLWFQLTYNYNYIWAKIELSKHFLSTFQFNQHLWPGCLGIIITKNYLKSHLKPNSEENISNFAGLEKLVRNCENVSFVSDFFSSHVIVSNRSTVPVKLRIVKQCHKIHLKPTSILPFHILLFPVPSYQS